MRKSLLARLCLAASVALAVLPVGCHRAEPWRLVKMDGRLPSLAFHMTSARSNTAVTAADYRGKIVVLEFGYTSCPDVCPTTLLSLTKALRELGGVAQDVRVLFVTVDPQRDTTPILRQYVDNFGPQVDGLSGTPNELASLARRYRVAYSVTQAPKSQDIAVMHTPTLYIFDRSGRLRLLSPQIGDNGRMKHDLRRLIREVK